MQRRTEPVERIDNQQSTNTMLARFVTALLVVASTLHASRAMAQERQWSFDQTDTDAYLVFGVPESDDVGLSLWCTKGSGNISLFVPATDAKLKPNRNVKLSLSVAGKRFRLVGKTSENKTLETTSAEIALKEKHPFFDALVKGDRISVRVGASEHIYPLAEAEFGTFLELCHKR